MSSPFPAVGPSFTSSSFFLSFFLAWAGMGFVVFVVVDWTCQVSMMFCMK